MTANPALTYDNVDMLTVMCIWTHIRRCVINHIIVKQVRREQISYLSILRIFSKWLNLSALSYLRLAILIGCYCASSSVFNIAKAKYHHLGSAGIRNHDT